MPAIPAYPVPVAVGSIKSVSDPIVVEIFIDPACPYSRKLYLKIKDILDDWTNVQFRVTLVPQPWHPQSPVMCEVLLAAKMYAASKTSDGKPEAMAKAFASGLTENYIHQELIGIDGVTDGRTRFENQKAMAKCIANGDEEMEQGILKCLEPVVPKEGLRHNGNGVSQELKWSVRYHRVRGVHVTPTVFVNGLEMGDIGSSSSVEDWSAKLEGVGAVKA